jgi:hypothetical protein
MEIRDLIINGCSILTVILLILLLVFDNFPVFIPLIPLCIMVVCFVIDSQNIVDDKDNWFDKKL